MSDGSHSLIVYAKDAAGNTGASETIYFTIEPQQPEPQPAEPLQLWIVATIAIVIGAGVALLVYFTKIKKTTKKAK